MRIATADEARRDGRAGINDATGHEPTKGPAERTELAVDGCDNTALCLKRGSGLSGKLYPPKAPGETRGRLERQMEAALEDGC